MDPNTVYVLESRLISIDGATQIPISEFEVSGWHNSRVCIWYFQVCKFQFCLLAEYFISVNNCSCSHINFGRLGEISHFEFHIHFKDIGHMASSTKNATITSHLQFLNVAFGRFGFFLTSTFPALKHHQPCTLLQSASHLQLSIGAFGKTKLQKLLGPTNLYESIFCCLFLRAHLPRRLFVQRVAYPPCRGTPHSCLRVAVAYAVRLGLP